MAGGEWSRHAVATLAYLKRGQYIVFDDCGARVGACWPGRGGILPCGISIEVDDGE